MTMDVLYFSLMGFVLIGLIGMGIHTVVMAIIERKEDERDCKELYEENPVMYIYHYEKNGYKHYTRVYEMKPAQEITWHDFRSLCDDGIAYLGDDDTIYHLRGFVVED